MTPAEYRHFTLSVGFGHSQSRINAFDRALVAAGISDYNLIKISSILPPECIQEESVVVRKGGLLPTAYTYIHANSVGTLLAAAVAVGVPEDSRDIGVIIKHCGYSSKDEIEQLACSFAMQAMNDRRIKIKTVVSAAIECSVEISEDYCAFAAVSLW